MLIRTFSTRQMKAGVEAQSVIKFRKEGGRSCARAACCCCCEMDPSAGNEHKLWGGLFR